MHGRLPWMSTLLPSELILSAVGSASLSSVGAAHAYTAEDSFCNRRRYAACSADTKLSSSARSSKVARRSALRREGHPDERMGWWAGRGRGSEPRSAKRESGGWGGMATRANAASGKAGARASRYLFMGVTSPRGAGTPAMKGVAWATSPAPAQHGAASTRAEQAGRAERVGAVGAGMGGPGPGR